MDDSPVSSCSRDDVLSQVRASLVSNGSITAVYAAPSRIHGQGLHAKKDFRTGEFICEYYGVLTSRQDSSDGFAVNAFLKVDCNLSKYKPQDLYCLLDPKTDKTAGLFLNHSCAANAVVLPLNLQSHLGFTDAEAQYLRYPIARSALCDNIPASCFDDLAIVLAIRDIQPGEEIVYSYQTEKETSIPCNCGTKLCSRFF